MITWLLVSVGPAAIRGVLWGALGLSIAVLIALGAIMCRERLL